MRFIRYDLNGSFNGIRRFIRHYSEAILNYSRWCVLCCNGARFKLRSFILLLLFIAVASGAQPQTLHYSLAAPWLGAGAASSRFEDVFSFTQNQAALAHSGHPAVGLYSERKFMLQELSLYRFAFVFPLGQDGAGLSLARFGYTGLYESAAGLAYGKHLGKADVGIQLNYYMVQSAGYGTDATAYAETGAVWHAGGHWHIRFHLFNPYGGRFRKNREEKLASEYTTSLSYEFSENFMVHAAFIKEEDQPPRITGGFQYRYSGRLFVNGGIATAGNSPYFSCGWEWKQLRADVAASWHLQLGLTPGLVLMYNLDHPEKPADE